MLLFQEPAKYIRLLSLFSFYLLPIQYLVPTILQQYWPLQYLNRRQ